MKNTDEVHLHPYFFVSLECFCLCCRFTIWQKLPLIYCATIVCLQKIQYLCNQSILVFMNQSIKFLLVAVAAISMASCSTGYYLGNSQNVNLSQTQVVLSQANFQVVKQVNVTYVYKNLHKKGSINAAQIKEGAYAALVREAKLTGAQTIINVTMEQVERKATHLFRIFPKYEQAILVSGTVIEFLPAGILPAKTDITESYLTVEPAVGQKAHASKVVPNDNYSLLQERYATTYPAFWKSFNSVRKYLIDSDMIVSLNYISDFLLSDAQSEIAILIQEVHNNQNFDEQQLTNLFILHTNKYRNTLN